MTGRPPGEHRLAAETRSVVAELNDTHGLDFALHSRCSSGMQSGAWLLVDGTGRRAVLKWDPSGDESALHGLAQVVERLRAGGYPTPAWLAVGAVSSGGAYHLQEFAVGRPSYPLTPTSVDLLIGVLERQAGLDPTPTRDRSAAVAAAAADETAGSDRHAVRQLGAVGSAVIESYDRLLASHGEVRLPGGDLVHGDYNTCNILQAHGRVSAVIDIEELGSGTRVIDYACLLREAHLQGYHPEVTRSIRRAGEAIAGPGALALCTAATAYFIVEFKRRHQPELLGATLDGLRQLADDLARPLT